MKPKILRTIRSKVDGGEITNLYATLKACFAFYPFKIFETLQVKSYYFCNTLPHWQANSSIFYFMQLLSLQPAPPLRKKTAEFIIESLKIGLTVKPLQLLYGKEHFAKELQQFKTLPAGTVGNDYAALLDQYSLKPIPRHENHDLWHVLLGYGMTSEEEIRMQAFLYGNGSRSIYCHLFLLSGLILPGSWKLFYADYLKGKATKCILALDITECCTESTSAIRQRYGIEA